MAHVHKDLIIAWANGSKIEYYSYGCKDWIETDAPVWDRDVEYRIKGQSTGWIKVDGVKPAGFYDNPKVEWYSADGRMNRCYLNRLRFGAGEDDPQRIVFIRILKDE